MNGNHEKFKRAMKIAGITLFLAGIVFIVIGAVDFFGAFSGETAPTKFWAFFVGFPLFAAGMSMTLIGFHREIAKYMKDETMPVFNEAGKEMSPAVQAIAKAAAQGAKEGTANAADGGEEKQQAKICSDCGTANDEDSTFCKNCGKCL